MPAPSALQIATQSVQRLLKEESYYHKELASQQNRIKKLEEDLKSGSADSDPNAEYILKQEQTALAETEKVFNPLRKRLGEAVRKLEEQIALSEGEGASGEELTKAKDALEAGQKVAEKED
ncbi:hypothetical protein VTK73DRAFT_9159 [Phialemonium thermophilum]|uniref:Tubulin-specific chaperone A n=1 Tax=Phialemonium thermophilum TaxID=223376 RepID=A0ABR3W473_9PEZI